MRTFTYSWYFGSSCGADGSSSVYGAGPQWYQWAPAAGVSYYATLTDCQNMGMGAAQTPSRCDWNAHTCDYTWGRWAYGVVLPGCDVPGQTSSPNWGGNPASLLKYNVSGCQVYTP